jgi:hypothetical protein
MPERRLLAEPVPMQAVVAARWALAAMQPQMAQRQPLA